MKKILCTMMALLLLFSVTNVFAACSHQNQTGIDDMHDIYTIYEPYSEKMHMQYTYVVPKCLDCGKVLTAFAWNIDPWPHEFSGDTCVKCGYNRNGNTPSNKVEELPEVPTMEDLQKNVKALIAQDEKIIGSKAKIVYGGNVRKEPSEKAEIIGRVNPEEKYEILYYGHASNGNVWLMIRYDDGHGWISASLAAIVPAVAPELVNSTVTVKIQSGTVRTIPGIAGDCVGSIYRGEKYKILECDYDSFGKLWYRIRITEGEGWISSNVVEEK